MTQMNAGITNVVRPQALDDVVGLEHVKKRLHYDIMGCQRSGEPYPSYILSGTAGCGKTTVAGIIITLIKTDVRLAGREPVLHKYLGSELKSAGSIADIATMTQDGDVVFIEEAHGLGNLAQIVLLEWIENFKLLGAMDGESSEAPKVSFVLATTNPGKIRKPLRERCIPLSVGYYKVDELKKILAKAATKLDLDLTADEAALTLLAQSSRGTPRIAILHRLTFLRRVMAVDNLPYNYETVKRSLEQNGINDYGLEANDILYCETLADKTDEFMGKSVSLKVMQHCGGFEPDLVDMIEAYLFQIGAIQISSQGRRLTTFGYSLINRMPKEFERQVAAAGIRPKKEIDMEKLKLLLEDEDNRKLGMKGLMGQFGLRYVVDNNFFKEKLLELGYTVQKKAGIIPV